GIGDANADTCEGHALQLRFKETARNLREQGLGKNGIDHAAAAFQFSAAAGNEIDDSIVVGEGDTVVRGETFLDARKLKADDALQYLITQRVVRDHGEPAKQRGGKHFEHWLAQRLRNSIDIRLQLRVLAHVHDQIAA